MCQFQLDFEDDMRAVLLDAFNAGRDAVEAPDPEVWVELKIRELLTPWADRRAAR